MNKNDPYRKAEALRKALKLQTFDSAPNGLSPRVSNERYDDTFEQRLSSEDRRLLKDMGIAV